MTLTRDSEVMISEDIYWIGGDDRTANIFEGAFPIPEGVSYNSYVIMDEKTALLDTCDLSISAVFWKKLRSTLAGRPLDYFVINHMEPDHGAAITQVLEMYPEVTVVGNSKTFDMLYNFYGLVPKNKLEVKEGDELSLGKHNLKFVFAVMVHWPEVMFSYDTASKTLFSADAFGTFKTLSGALYADETDFDSEYLEEARRYYSNIVGKYGSKVQAVFKKLEGVPIEMICPLHGPIWRKDFGYILGKYDTWSKYEPEEEGVLIAYASMYGNTESAAQALAARLCEKGITNVAVYDVSNTHVSTLIAETFRYSHLVLASVTYNLGIYPVMHNFLADMKALNVQNRTVAIVENGSWACKSGELMEQFVRTQMKNMTVLDRKLSLASSLPASKAGELESLADAIVESVQKA